MKNLKKLKSHTNKLNLILKHLSENSNQKTLIVNIIIPIS